MKLRSWYAVHGRIDLSPPPDRLLESIRPRIPNLVCHFDLVDGQWRSGLFSIFSTPVVSVLRARPGDEEFLLGRPGWAEELRAISDGPNRESVLTHLEQTRQTIYLTPVVLSLGEARLARVCEQLCGQLARESQGLIQGFAVGFFNAEGESLWPHAPRHRLRTR